MAQVLTAVTAMNSYSTVFPKIVEPFYPVSKANTALARPV